MVNGASGGDHESGGRISVILIKGGNRVVCDEFKMREKEIDDSTLETNVW